MRARSADPTRDGPSHPVALVALALLLVNDHLLKSLVPGWWTGKLSDLAFLVVAPVLASALLARAGVPATRARVVGVVCVGAAFVVLQLWPPLGEAAVAVLGGTHTPDPTDLLALPALLVVPACWRRATPRWWALPLAGAACLATSWSTCGDARLPEDGATDVDPAQHLQLAFGYELVPDHSPTIERNIRLFDDRGQRVPLVFAVSGGSVNACPVATLRPNTTYTWRVGPFVSHSTNHVAPPRHDHEGRWRFTTGPDTGGRAASTRSACARRAFAGCAERDPCDYASYGSQSDTGSPTDTACLR